MVNTLRWLAVVPAAILGLCLGIRLTGWLISGADRLAYRYSGFLFPDAPWWGSYVRPAAECLGAAVTAFLMVTLAALVAPAQRLLLACAVFCTGAALALAILSVKSEYAPLIAAIAGGLLAALLTKWAATSPDRTQ